MGDLSANFSRWEFACRCGFHGCAGRDQMDPHFIAMLQDARNFFKRPIQIISGFRCQHHDLTKKRPGSKHAQGIAADIVVCGYTPIRAAEFLFNIPHWREVFNGIGVNWPKGTLHLDTRPLQEICRWTYKADGTIKRINGIMDLHHAKNEEARTFIVA